MKSAVIRNSLGGTEWLNIKTIAVGKIPSGMDTADLFVTVSEHAHPLLRIDLYSYPDEAYAFQESIIWGEFIVVGFGHRVHLVDLSSLESSEVNLGSYYGHMQVHGEELLIASAEHVFCLSPDGKIRWQSPQLGIDGVVLHESTKHVVSGAGEWDPPGGWKSFRLSASNGALL